MPIRNVVLTRQQENFVGKLVATGRYQSADNEVCSNIQLKGRTYRFEIAYSVCI